MLFHMPPESFKLILDPTCGKKRMWNGWAEAATLYKITFADSGNFGDNWRLGDSSILHQSLAGNRERHIRPGDCRGASAPVRLQHVTV